VAHHFFLPCKGPFTQRGVPHTGHDLIGAFPLHVIEISLKVMTPFKLTTDTRGVQCERASLLSQPTRADLPRSVNGPSVCTVHQRSFDRLSNSPIQRQ